MVFGSIVLIAGGAIVAFMALLGRDGRLPRNRWAGIRLPSTMRSDKAWYAAHKASWGYQFVLGAAMATYGVILMRTSPGDESLSLVWLFIVVMFASTIGSVVVARRAALDADSGSPDDSNTPGAPM